MSIGRWAEKHPWMTFFLASSAIGVVQAVVAPRKQLSAFGTTVDIFPPINGACPAGTKLVNGMCQTDFTIDGRGMIGIGTGDCPPGTTRSPWSGCVPDVPPAPTPGTGPMTVPGFTSASNSTGLYLGLGAAALVALAAFGGRR